MNERGRKDFNNIFAYTKDGIQMRKTKPLDRRHVTRLCRSEHFNYNCNERVMRFDTTI